MNNVVSWSVHCYEVANGLSRQGHNVVLMNGKSFVQGPMNDNGSKPVQPSLWMRLENKWNWFRMLRPIRREITILWLFGREAWVFLIASSTIIRRRGRIDVIYGRHRPFSCQSLIAKVFRIYSVKEVNGLEADESKIRKKEGLSLRLIDKMERMNIKKADKIIVVTPRLKDVLQEDYKVPGDKIAVVTNGANTDLFKPIDPAIAKERLNLNQDNRYICYVGAFYAWQKIDELIKSAPLVLQKYPDTRYLIVGDGEMKEELVALASQLGISDEMIFPGVVNYQNIYLYINASDVCVLTKPAARSGLSPLKLYEYMACARPIIASRVIGLDILEEYRSGMLVNTADSQELADATIMLLENRELGKEMGSNGRKYVVENQSWDSVARKVADVCQGLVDGRKELSEV